MHIRVMQTILDHWRSPVENRVHRDMKIKDAVTPGSLFSKRIHRIDITDVTPMDAKQLTEVLYRLYGVRVSVSARVEIYINGKVRDGRGNETTLSISDGWQTQEGYAHFLKGYELAMLLNGVDVHRDHLDRY